MMETDEAVFTINGKVYKVGAEVPPTTSLNTFIREHALLLGTKFMCKEGSCGSCIVNLKYIDKRTQKQVSAAVNSCLMPIFTCHGCAITTIEGIGSRAAGYNKVQTTLAHFNGTQCGFCSPGMVMSMYSLLDANPKATTKDVENNFSGNICRCTGYRPILDAFKSLSSDPPVKLKRRLLDIEDSHMLCPYKGNCKNNEENCNKCMNEPEKSTFELDFSELHLSKNNFHLKGTSSEWYRAESLKDIFEIFDKIESKSYMLIAGNGSRGVKKPSSEPEVYIDINNVTDLKRVTSCSSSFNVGSMINLHDYIAELIAISANNPNAFGYASQMANHILLVANKPVRNRATVGGSLGLVNKNLNFPSDIFLLLNAIKASITIVSLSGIKEEVSPTEFRTLDLNKKVITNIAHAAQRASTKLVSYKIMPVSQSAVAIVNAAFLYDIDNNGKINKTPSIVYSGINPLFIRASGLETFLTDKNLFENSILGKAISILWDEVQPDSTDLTLFSSDYRKLLAVSLFYKSVLNLAGLRADTKLRSGGTVFVRPISSGQQVFQTDATKYPITQPMPKLEAQIQCSGEARFINDLLRLPTELSAQLVVAKEFADITSIDPSDALKIPGVVGFFSVDDIPGKNNILHTYASFVTDNMELFSSGKISYWGQPVGVIVAKTSDIADFATNYVKINYSTPKKPILNIQDVLNSEEKGSRVKLEVTQKAKSPGSGGIHEFSGEIDISETGQYGHAIETPSCVVYPLENSNYKVYVSTQTTSLTNICISQVLGVPLNKIDCIVPRVGGSFGSKILSHMFGVCSCALAASKLQSPVRMVMTVESEMNSTLKRSPFYAKYKGMTDATGKIQGMNIDIFINYGSMITLKLHLNVVNSLISYFDSDTWNINVYSVLTDKTPLSALRGPGFMEPLSIIEQIMDHIAFICKLNPTDVRIANSADENINTHIKNWVQQTEFDSRKLTIDKFNSENRWKKKGLSLTAARYAINFYNSQLACTVGILHPDGTVQVQQAGIEMGQGLNTKVAQVVAHELNVPLSSVQVKETSSLNCVNAYPTWGSFSSELAVHVAIHCCKQLNKGLNEAKKLLKNPTWTEIVTKAYDMVIPLSINIPVPEYPKDPEFGHYYVYGVAVAETELDLLTGQHQVTRVDILEDVGKSMSPEIDVGQIEGSFIMALGLHTSERLVYDPNTGALLTNRLWFYHVPGSQDIPIDFRVTFVPNSSNPKNILNSKATGEPATSLAVSVVNSIRQAIISARNDAGLKELWIQLASPCTLETILMASGTSKEQFIL